MFVLKVETDGSAFHKEVRDDFFDADTTFDFLELASILRKVEDAIRSGETTGKARDTNGNTVATWSLT